MTFLSIHGMKHAHRECHAWSEFIGFIQSLQRKKLYYAWAKNGSKYNIVFEVK